MTEWPITPQMEERLTALERVPPAPVWSKAYWLHRRASQRHLDPSWLSRQWSDALHSESVLLPGGAGRTPPRGSGWPSAWPFLSPDDRPSIRADYAHSFPRSAHRLVNEADELKRGRFAYCGSYIEFGGPAEWFKPRADVRSGWLHLQPASFRWIHSLGRAYWLTDDVTYARHALQWLDEWLAIAQDFRSDFWTSTCDTGTRGLCMVSALGYFADVLAEDPPLRRRLGSIAHLHARLVARRREVVGYNHVIWSAHDLALLGLAFEGSSPHARDWQRLGLHELERQVTRQFWGDGVLIEGSCLYQVYVTKLLVEVVNAYDRAGRNAPAILETTVRRSCAALSRLQRPDGRLFLFGDCYRGRDVNLEGSLDEAAWAVRAWCGCREEQAGNGQVAEALWLVPWLFGEHQACRESNNGRVSDEGTAEGPRALGHESGLCSLTSGRSDGVGLTVLVNVADSLEGSVHAHADALSLQFASESGPVLVDSGSFGEAASPMRDFFRGPASHNLVMVDSVPAPRLSGVFHMRPGKRCAADALGALGHVAFCTARDLRFLAAGVKWTRDVVLWRSSAVVVIDRLASGHPFLWRRQFQFAEGGLERVGPVLEWEGTESWQVTLLHSTAPRIVVASGVARPPRGWRSEERGSLSPAPMLVEEGGPSTDLVLVACFSRGDEPALCCHLGGRLSEHRQRVPSWPHGWRIVESGGAHLPELEVMLDG